MKTWKNFVGEDLADLQHSSSKNTLEKVQRYKGTTVLQSTLCSHELQTIQMRCGDRADVAKAIADEQCKWKF